MYSEITEYTLDKKTNVLTWVLPFTVTGEYELFATYKSVKISCDVCSLTITPEAFSFESSSMEYLNPWVNYNIAWDQEKPIFE